MAAPSLLVAGVCLVMALIMMVAGVCGKGDALFVLSRPLVLVFLYWICSWFVVPTFCNSSCMAIYLLHPAMIYAVNHTILASAIFGGVSSAFTMSAVMVLMSIAFFHMLKKYMPLGMNVLFGWR